MKTKLCLLLILSMMLTTVSCSGPSTSTGSEEAKLEDSAGIIYLDDYQYGEFEKDNCIITGLELVIGKKCMLVSRNNYYYSSVKACINCADGLFKYQLEEVV